MAIKEAEVKECILTVSIPTHLIPLNPFLYPFRVKFGRLMRAALRLKWTRTAIILQSFWRRIVGCNRAALRAKQVCKKEKVKPAYVKEAMMMYMK